MNHTKVIFLLMCILVVGFTSCTSNTGKDVRLLTNSSGVWTLDGWPKTEYEKMPKNSGLVILKYFEAFGGSNPVRYEVTVYWDEAAELDVIALRNGRKYAEMFFVYNQYTDTLVKLADLEI